MLLTTRISVGKVAIQSSTNERNCECSEKAILRGKSLAAIPCWHGLFIRQQSGLFLRLSTCLSFFQIYLSCDYSKKDSVMYIKGMITKFRIIATHITGTLTAIASPVLFNCPREIVVLVVETFVFLQLPSSS